MALRLRRGTNADRLTITPADGELIYTTDTRKIFAGDGSTVGGNFVSGINDIVEDLSPQLGGNLDLNSSNIVGNGNIDITGSITASNGITGDFKGSVFGDDSSLLVDAITNTFNGNLTGDVVGNVTGNLSGNVVGTVTGSLTGSVTGTLDGDVTGSVFADNSTLIVDAINNVITTSNLITSSITPSDNNLIIFPNQSLGSVKNNLTIGSVEDRSDLHLQKYSTSDLSADTDRLGGILFEANDPINGLVRTSSIYGRRGQIEMVGDSTGFYTEDKFLVLQEGLVGIGTGNPTEKLDVRGNGVFSGTLEAAAFKGSYMLDDSTTIVDGINGTITAAGFIQFGAYSDAEIAEITPVNGMVYYNNSQNKFRGYQNGAWINLDDGTAA